MYIECIVISRFYKFVLQKNKMKVYNTKKKLIMKYKKALQSNLVYLGFSVMLKNL